MDAKLAEIYGTNEIEDTDLEKAAAAELAQKLAGDEDPTAGLTEEELEQLAAEILSADSEDGAAVEEPIEAAEETEEVAVEEPTEDGEIKMASEEESQEKLAEADYLGRVMAHAFTQELRNIEKTAGAKMDAAKDAAKGAAGKVGGFLSKHKKKSMAVGAAGVGAAGFAAGRKSKKASAEVQETELSAVDTLALARAREILAVNGIDPDTGAPIETEEKTAGAAEEQLALTVEERAMALLTEAGYEFEQPELQNEEE